MAPATPAAATIQEAAAAAKPKDVQIVREGTRIIIPENMSYADARTWLKRREDEEEKEVELTEIIDAAPLDGAWAFSLAIAEKFGFSARESTPGFWGPTPPQVVGVQCDVDEQVQVPWGGVSMPGLAGTLQIGCTVKNNALVSCISGTVKQKSLYLVQDLMKRARAKVLTDSLYRGKAIRVRFIDPSKERFNPLDAPKFLDVRKTTPGDLVFNESTLAAIDVSIFTPIRKSDQCRALGIPLKRGVLLEGPYGTGKTLTATVTAKECINNGWTFVYLERAGDIVRAMHFAKTYAPCVIFAEDIDRATEGERDEQIDAILNAVDGVDTKGAEIMLVVTTNNVDGIEPAMLRPGRLDAVITVQPPDARTAMQLVAKYAAGLMDPQEDYTKVGEALSGLIPAVIREVVERSKLAALRHSTAANLRIRGKDLIDAAGAMVDHNKRLAMKKPDDRSDVEKAAAILSEAMVPALKPVSNGAPKSTRNLEATS